MANRLVMLKLVGPAAGGKEATGSVRAKAVLMLRVEGESVSIENGALVKASSHQAWSAFQDASRKFLEAKDVLIFRLEGSTRPLRSVLTLLSQPSNSVSVIVTQVPRDPLPASPRALSKSSQHQHTVQPSAEDLDGVLRRTEEICRSFSSERSCGSSPAALVSAGLDSRPTRSLESLSPRSRSARSSAGPPSPETCSSVPLDLDECDLEVERLLQLSDSLTQHKTKVGHPVLPDAPRNVTILKNFSGGVFVIWDPIRLDASDKNNGHLVTGYLVSLNGRLVARATGAVSCQVELKKLEANKDYVLTVSTCADMCQSVPSKQVHFTTRSTMDHCQQQGGQTRARRPHHFYRSHSARPVASYRSGSSDSDSSLALGVAHSQSVCSVLPYQSKAVRPSGRTTSANSSQYFTPSQQTRPVPISRSFTSGGQTRPVSSSRGSTPNERTRPVPVSRGSTPNERTRPVPVSRGSTPNERTRPVPVSRGSTPNERTRPVPVSRGSTPGGQTRPVSSSRGSTPNERTRPVPVSRGSTPGGQTRPVSSSRGSTPNERRPVREAEDSQSSCSTLSSGVFTDYPSPKSSFSRSRHVSTSPSRLALNSQLSSCLGTPCRTQCSVSSEPEAACPMPPSHVRAQLNASTLSVSWEPVRRDKEGRSGGCYVLGYRVYVSGRPVASVDGAGSEHVLVDLPPVLAASCARVDVRTRAISGESENASAVVYSTGLGLKDHCNSPIRSICLRCETCV